MHVCVIIFARFLTPQPQMSDVFLSSFQLYFISTRWDDKQDRPRPAGASGREVRNTKSLKRELDSSILFFFVYADIKPANLYSPLVHLKASRWNKFNMKVIKSQRLNLTPQTFLKVCWGAIVVRETGGKRTEVEWNFKVNFFFGAVSSIFSGKLREAWTGEATRVGECKLGLSWVTQAITDAKGAVIIFSTGGAAVQGHTWRMCDLLRHEWWF